MQVVPFKILWVAGVLSYCHTVDAMTLYFNDNVRPNGQQVSG